MEKSFEDRIVEVLENALIKSFGDRASSSYDSNPLNKLLCECMEKYAPRIKIQVETSIERALASGEFQAVIDNALKEKLLAAALAHILRDTKVK